MAHCASLGENEDLDDPDRAMKDNFDLFWSMIKDEKYEGLLYADISGLTQINRYDGRLDRVIGETSIHDRLVNGSDYPLPAVNVLIHTGRLADDGFLTDAEADALNEIYRYNPLLFDFVLKRTLRHPETGVKFPAEMFYNRFAGLF